MVPGYVQGFQIKDAYQPFHQLETSRLWHENNNASFQLSDSFEMTAKSVALEQFC